MTRPALPGLRAALLLALFLRAPFLPAAAPGDSTFVPRATFTDALGQTHIRYRQYHKGLRVWGAEAIEHRPAPGASLPGAAWDGAPPPTSWETGTTPRLALADAYAQAVAPLGPLAAPPGLLSSELVIYPIEQSFVPEYPTDRDLNATDEVTYQAGTVLAYDLHLGAADGTGSGQEVLVDAETGEVLSILDDAEAAAVPSKATGRGFYSGTVALDVSTPDGGGPFQLIDLTRGVRKDASGAALPGTGNQVVIGNLDSGRGVVVSNAGTTWGNGLRYAFNAPLESDSFKTMAVDAAYGLQCAWDYFKVVHGRAGVDNQGTAVTADLYHANPSILRVDNVAWINGGFRIEFGPTFFYLAEATPFTLGHEFTHGVTEYAAQLIYRGESGGLNEATSDIFGHEIDTWRSTGGGRAEPRTALIGDRDTAWTLERLRMADLSPVLARAMDQPSLDGVSPDAWREGLESLDVHQSSGPMNRAFYFLSKGASAVSGDRTYSRFLPAGMTGIGNDKAARIWYRALTAYLRPDARYADARMAAIKSAIDLYGQLSPEDLAVRMAFGAINVGDPADRSTVPSEALGALSAVTATCLQEGRTLTFTARTDADAKVASLTFLVDGIPVGHVMPAAGTLPPLVLTADQLFASGSHRLQARVTTLLGTTVVSPEVPFSLDLPVQQLLKDPGFEAVVPATKAWACSGSASIQGRFGTRLFPRTGELFARFDSATDTLRQRVALPAGFAGARLTFWARAIGLGSDASPAMNVEVRSMGATGTAPAVLATLATVSARDLGMDWRRFSVDVSGLLSPLGPRTVDLVLNDLATAGAATLLVDDVTLVAAQTALPAFVTVTPPTLAVEPASLSAAALTATVTGGAPGVTWSVREAGGGSLDSGFHYQAPPTPGIYHAVATSTADPTAWAEVSITVEPTLALAPSTPAGGASVMAGTTLDLTPYFISTSGAPAFTVQEPGGGTILTGAPPTYAAPATPGTYHVNARVGTGSPVTLTVNVLPVVRVEVSPATINIAAGQVIELTTQVIGNPDQAVTFRGSSQPFLGEVGIPELSFLGSEPRYEAPPAPVAADAFDEFVVESVAVPGARTTVRVTIQNGVAVQPLRGTVLPGMTFPFTATVPNGSQQVAWSVAGGAANGTISPAGVYTAPATPGTYTVTAAAAGYAAGSATLVVAPADAAALLARVADAYGQAAPQGADFTGTGREDDQNVQAALVAEGTRAASASAPE